MQWLGALLLAVIPLPPVPVSASSLLSIAPKPVQQVVTDLAVSTSGNVIAPDFYTPPAPLPAVDHGTLIKTEPMLVPTVLSATATRIMYASTDTHDQPIAVTGTYFAPVLPWFGATPRPIVTYAAGTQGVADRCAPSQQFSLGLEYEAGMINALIARGYAVVVTDYEGLGTPGVHTYMNRSSQGHAVLDAARAAQQISKTAGPIGIWGYSQGGGAAAAAAELESTYTPELNVRGAAIGAPPADLKAVGPVLDKSLYATFLGYAILSLDAAYPDAFDINDILNDTGRQMMTTAGSLCTVEGLAAGAFTDTSTLTNDGRPLTAYLDEEPYSSLLDLQRIGDRPPSIPVFIGSSTGDDVVPHAQAKQMARDWCAGGTVVKFRAIAIPGHIASMAEFGAFAFPWMQNALGGAASTNACGTF